MAKKRRGVAAWFIEQRTRSLATIYLTRRDDLTVTAGEEDGIDVDVAIRTRKPAVRWKFGVVLRGTRADLSAEQANEALTPALEALSARAFPYPVCLFFFRMENDKGFYTWVAEPVVTDDGSPVLLHATEAACAELDTDAVNEIVEAVSRWYSAFMKAGTEAPKRRRKASGVEVLHGIIDGEAEYVTEHGKPPKLLKLPLVQDYDLAKLGREHLGDLAGELIEEGGSGAGDEGVAGDEGEDRDGPAGVLV